MKPINHKTKGPPRVASGAALGRMIYDARKQKPPERFAGSLLIYRGKANAWVMGWYNKGKYHTDAYDGCPARYWYPLPPWDNALLLAQAVSELKSETIE